jgi:glycine cleavage system H protein
MMKESFMYPDDRRYSKEHEWVRVDGERGTIGVTDFAQSQLGDVVFLELPEVGTSIEAGQQFGTVESVKAVSELYAPVSGEVLEANADLTATPEDLNADPHGKAWMLVVKLADPKQLETLMDAAAYQAFAEAESK